MAGPTRPGVQVGSGSLDVQIQERLEMIHKQATASRHIHANELLLFHAGVHESTCKSGSDRVKCRHFYQTTEVRHG